MSLEKAKLTFSAKQIKSMVANGKINNDHIIQRGYVWERSRKSALIESMIIGYPIPPVFAKRIEDDGKKNNNIYYIMDGKQRLSTIKEYLNDEFALSALPPVTYFNDEENKECTLDISGYKFSELPESLQNHLSTITIDITYFDNNITPEEERELFKRLNAGKPLSTKSRLLASCKNIEGLLDIGSHALFADMLTEKAKENKNQVALVMKFWCMLNKDIESVSFESKTFNPLLENTTITEEEKAELLKVFDALHSVHGILVDGNEKKLAKKLYTETHIVSVAPHFYKAINDGISETLLAEWLIEFYGCNDTASISEEYNDACVGGSAKNINIVRRHNELAKSYDQFFTVDKADEFTNINEALPEDKDESIVVEEVDIKSVDDIDIKEDNEFKKIVDDMLLDGLSELVNE